MQKHHRKNQIRTFVIIVALILIYSSIYRLFWIPGNIKIIKGREHNLEINLPLKLQLFCTENNVLDVNGTVLNSKRSIDLKKPITFYSTKQGIYDLEFRLLGVFPIKKIKVHVMPERQIVPGGHSVGVKLKSKGLIVVGLADILDYNNQESSPAKDAGIEIGDIIYKVNGQDVNTAEEMSKIINNQKNKRVELSIKRENKYIKRHIRAVKSNTGIYQLGIWIRDVAAGVGTLTFYDPDTGYYGALGHLISDTDTGKTVEVKEGEIIRAKVISISPGRKNLPGEKKGVFINEEQKLGNIISNTDYGIFGEAFKPLKNPIYPTLPVAPACHVKEGRASILTVVEGEKIEKYDIDIQKILKSSSPTSKGMIIKIVDSNLIDKTGGIIQGMSGSPIIQDGYLVGAVTHVFVNDPSRGYGVFVEWMLDETSKLPLREQVMTN